MHGLYPYKFTTTLMFLLLVFNSKSIFTPVHCTKSPDRVGNPSLPARLKGVSWTNSTVVDDSLTQNLLYLILFAR